MRKGKATYLAGVLSEDRGWTHGEKGKKGSQNLVFVPKLQARLLKFFYRQPISKYALTSRNEVQMVRQNLPIVIAVLLVSSCIAYEGSDSDGKGIEGRYFVPSFSEERVFILDLFDSYGRVKGKRAEFVVRVNVKTDVERVPIATIEFKESHDEGGFELIENTKIEEEDSEKFVIEGQDSSSNDLYVTVTAERGRFVLSELKINKLNGDYFSEITEIELRRPQEHEMSPPGLHLLRAYQHLYEGDTKTTRIDTHFIEKPDEMKMYFFENLQFLYWHNTKKYPRINAIKGFSGHHNLDSVIQFWLDYWRSKGVKFPEGLEPLHIKALIAAESSFNPKARARTTSATGLMQILESVLEHLKGVAVNNWREVPDNYIRVSLKDLEDPIVNIAVGIRWLGHKFYLLRKHSRKGVRETLRDYHSRDRHGRIYADKILRLYQLSR